MSVQSQMLAVVALNNRQYNFTFRYCYSGDYLTRASGRMDMPGVNPPDMPRTLMLSGEWRKTLWTTHRALSPQTLVIICT